MAGYGSSETGRYRISSYMVLIGERLCFAAAPKLLVKKVRFHKLLHFGKSISGKTIFFNQFFVAEGSTLFHQMFENFKFLFREKGLKKCPSLLQMWGRIWYNIK